MNATDAWKKKKSTTKIIPTVYNEFLILQFGATTRQSNRNKTEPVCYQSAFSLRGQVGNYIKSVCDNNITQH